MRNYGSFTITVMVFSMMTCVAVVASTSAEVPAVISYQGRLTDTAGTPVPDGDYTMKFTLYDAESAGNQVWGPEEWGSASTKVGIGDGLFAVRLGTHLPFSTAAFDKPYWLEVQVFNEGATAWETFSPRRRLASAPYALRAALVMPGSIEADSLLSGSVTGEKIASGVITDTHVAASGLSAGKITSGLLDNARVNWAAPGMIGTSIPSGGRFATLSVDSAVGIGTTIPSEALTVAGIIESTSGGFKFPDGSIQTNAALWYGEGPGGAFEIDAGTGGQIWSGAGDPFNTVFHDGRAQFIILASELSAAGMTAGDIDSISFRVYEQPGRDLANFRIRLQHTGQNTSTAWITSGWTRVFGPSTVPRGNLIAGNWCAFALDTVFIWDGTSNLLVDVSRDDTDWAYSGVMYVRTGLPDRIHSGHSDSAHSWPFDTMPGVTYAFIPEIKFGRDGGEIYYEEGNVGIGTTQPAQSFHVAGNAVITGSMGIGTTSPSVSLEVAGPVQLRGGATQTGLYVDYNGNVGIGTKSPSSALEVSGLISASGGTSSEWTEAHGWGNHGERGYLTEEDDPEVGTNATGYLSRWDGTALVAGSIYDNGAVGIGTTNPGGKLTVAGVVESSSGGFKFPDGSMQETASAGWSGESGGGEFEIVAGSGGVSWEVGSPFSTIYHDSRAQFIVLASELTTAGFSAGSIEAIDLHVSSIPGRDITDLRIRIQHTAQTTTTSWETGGWTLAYGPATIPYGDMTVGEWYTCVFDLSFEWDGVSNLMIDMSRDGTASAYGGGFYIRTGLTNRMCAESSDSAYAWPFDTMPVTGYHFIPEVRFQRQGKIYYMGGDVGIGTTSPARKLHVSGAVRLEPGVAPAEPGEGDMYMDSTDHTLKVYDGTQWRALW